MDRIVSSFVRGLGILKRRQAWGIVALCALFTLALYVGLISTIWAFLSGLTLFQWAWMDSLLDWLGTASAAILGLFLFPVLQPIFVALFAERIANHVEHEHYPQDAEPRDQPISETIKASLRLVLKSVGLNLLALPLYFFPMINVFTYYALNGYLLGREFYETVALRHMEWSEVNQSRKRAGLTVWLAGICCTILITIPFINIFAPLISIAMMVHLYHSLASRHSSSQHSG